ncbi:MAG: PLP-dependent transferase [Paludibaculum sp.]
MGLVHVHHPVGGRRACHGHHDGSRASTRVMVPIHRLLLQDAIVSQGAERARAFVSGTARSARWCSACARRATTSSPSASSTPARSCCCSRRARGFIDVTFVDVTDPAAWEAAVIPGRTVLLLAETPANPRLDLVDLEALGRIAGPLKVVDSTFATPLGQRPLSFGCDLVLHSATKAIAGHNDATLGVVAGEAELIHWLWSFAVLQGANASPFDAMNGLRGLRTLGVRLRQQSASVLQLAEALAEHPGAAEVRYPGLPSHPQHDLAKRQLDVMGGQLTFDVVGGLDAGRRFVESTRVAQLATSLGGPRRL